MTSSLQTPTLSLEMESDMFVEHFTCVFFVFAADDLLLWYLWLANLGGCSTVSLLALVWCGTSCIDF